MATKTFHVLLITAATDADRPFEALQYQVLECWWGNISLVTDPKTSLHFFTQELIDKNLIAFKHLSKLYFVSISHLFYIYIYIYYCRWF